MIFNSYIFVLLFLPMMLLGWFGINKLSYKLANLFLVGMSLWFYGYFNISYLFILLFSVVFNFVLSKLMTLHSVFWNKAILFFGVSINVLIIFYFKYYNFFVSNICSIFHKDYVLKEILLPLGISFFTFQQISFLVDSYRGETKDYSLIEYSMYVSYFPQLVAGPIVLHKELIPQFRDKHNRHISWENFYQGICFFTNGLMKKVWIADFCAEFVDWGFRNVDSLYTNDALLVMLLYTMQIYFDFSGYSDMAVGIGKMMNFDLPMNFNSPYRAITILDFWKRWHITLTRFLRQYIYIPLGGNQKGRGRKNLNILIVFLISGLWHGANWTFVLWGGLHGVLNVLERECEKYLKKIPDIIRWCLNICAISVLWLLFRSNSISEWISLIKIITNFKFGDAGVYLYVWPYRIISMIIGILNMSVSVSIAYEVFMCVWIIFLLVICVRGKNMFEREYCAKSIRAAYLYAVTYVLLILSLGQNSAFIYFNF